MNRDATSRAFWCIFCRAKLPLTNQQYRLPDDISVQQVSSICMSGIMEWGRAIIYSIKLSKVNTEIKCGYSSVSQNSQTRSSGTCSANDRNRSLVHSWGSPTCVTKCINMYIPHSDSYPCLCHKCIQGDWEVQLHSLLTLILDGENSQFHALATLPQEPTAKDSGPHTWSVWLRKKKRKISCPAMKWRPACSLVTISQKHRHFSFLFGFHVSVSYVLKHRQFVNYRAL
jgi:hypothetical protein